MAMKAESSLMIGLATAAVVYGVYQVSLPTTAASKADPTTGNVHLNSSRCVATWTSAAAVGTISLLAADPMIFIIGGAMIVALDFSHRVAQHTDNVTGKITNAVSGY